MDCFACLCALSRRNRRSSRCTVAQRFLTGWIVFSPWSRASRHLTRVFDSWKEHSGSDLEQAANSFRPNPAQGSADNDSSPSTAGARNEWEQYGARYFRGVVKMKRGQKKEADVEMLVEVRKKEKKSTLMTSKLLCSWLKSMRCTVQRTGRGMCGDQSSEIHDTTHVQFLQKTKTQTQVGEETAGLVALRRWIGVELFALFLLCFLNSRWWALRAMFGDGCSRCLT